MVTARGCPEGAGSEGVGWLSGGGWRRSRAGPRLHGTGGGQGTARCHRSGCGRPGPAPQLSADFPWALRGAVLFAPLMSFMEYGVQYDRTGTADKACCQLTRFQNFPLKSMGNKHST